MQERLQKIISRAGIASRRAGEEIILAGRVRVNGRVVTELGAKADLGQDTIEVDGRRVIPDAARYLVVHKPRGVVSTLSDPEGRPTVAGLLEGAGTRLYPVGRLDFATSGVLLVTNDGDFAQGLLHPRGGVPKTYVLKTRGVMTEDDLEHWRTGVTLEDGKTLPAEVKLLRHEEGKTWFQITLREGRNQQLRRMGEVTGFPVMRLARLSFAGITSEGLRPGQWRSLDLAELLALREEFGVPKKVRSAALGDPGTAGERRVRRPAAAAAAARGSRPERPSTRGDHVEARQRPERPSTRGDHAETRARPERSSTHGNYGETKARAERSSARSAHGETKARPERPSTHGNYGETKARAERSSTRSAHGETKARAERSSTSGARGESKPRAGAPRTSSSPRPKPRRER